MKIKVEADAANPMMKILKKMRGRRKEEAFYNIKATTSFIEVM